MNILHVKSIKLTHILWIRCVFRRFLPFKRVLPFKCVLLSLSYRRSQSCTLRFWPLSTQRWFAPRKYSQSAFFSAVVYDLRSLHLGNVSLLKFPVHFAGNERFLPPFPSSLLSDYALNSQTGYDRGRDLGTRSIFFLPRVVWSINEQYLPRPHRDTSPQTTRWN